MKLLYVIFENVGWVQIAATPLVIGLLLGAFIYFPEPITVRLNIGITEAMLGLILGAVWATKV